MVFGEIMEPSTRALIDDDFEEYPDHVEPNLEWEGDWTPPDRIQTLIFVETDKVKKLFKASVLNNMKASCSLKNGHIEMYKLPDDIYSVLYTEKCLTTGQIVQSLLGWIKKAENIYAITSASIATYQNANMGTRPETLIRTLSSKNLPKSQFKKLESPNLVTGLGAQVLTYAIHTGLKCEFFIMYMDASPLDSVNANPFVQLVQSLKLQVTSSSFNLNPPASNLYL